MQRFGSLRGGAHMAAIGGIFKAQCGVSDEKHQTEEVFAPAILPEENKRSLSQMLHGVVRSSSHGHPGV